ncbi:MULTISPECIES: hypothetical protein [Serratia]|uniref:Uncharacterized protein n=2 Tax=Serratia TaxID=613 RepID=A0A9X8VGZ0_SERMA|nr:MULTISPECIES: hypothetical protein [Serratia]MBS3895078.1 hypothetical protein [Serratia marcescens]TXE24116.1 hypothetical protein FOT63_23895 [Serratia ureilytica]HBC7422413.1 hypothetical protein [Serratia marcescens]
MALIALSYSLAEPADASGFLATFAPGVVQRRAEKIVARHLPSPAQCEETPPEEELVTPNKRLSLESNSPAKSLGLVVGDTLEPLFAAVIVITLVVTSVLLHGLTLAPLLHLRKTKNRETQPGPPPH